MAMRPEPALNTAGRIAQTLGVPLHRILYILRSRKHIRPTARAGRLRLYNLASIASIRHELNAIDARQSAREGEAK